MWEGVYWIKCSNLGINYLAKETLLFERLLWLFNDMTWIVDIMPPIRRGDKCYKKFKGKQYMLFLTLILD